MKKDPFADFEELKVSTETSEKTLKNSYKHINPNSTTLTVKYSLLFIASIFFSLAICPQSGVGLFRNDFPFFHHLLHQSELLCGLYCGIVFFMTTHLLIFFLLNHFEKLKIVKQFTYLPILYMGGFYGFSMTSLFSDNQFGWIYSLSWVLAVGLSYFAFNNFFSLKVGPPRPSHRS